MASPDARWGRAGRAAGEAAGEDLGALPVVHVVGHHHPGGGCGGVRGARGGGSGGQEVGTLEGLGARGGR